MSRTVTEVYEIYELKELSETAKEKAFKDWMTDTDYPWSEENEATLEAFKKIFPVRVRDWNYGYNKGIEWIYEGATTEAELTGVRLMAMINSHYGDDLMKGKYFYLWSKTDKKEDQLRGDLKTRYSKVMFDRECVLTGYYMDEEILKPIYEFLKKPTDEVTFYSLLDSCLDRWVSKCDEDYESYFSMEVFEKESGANNWMYHEDGTLYNELSCK